MPRGTRLTLYERGQIDAKHDLGMSMSQIGKSINRSVNVVKHYLDNPEKYGQKTRAGRPEKLSDADKRLIIRHASNSVTSVMEIKRSCNLDASKTTIWKAIRSSGVLQHRKMQKMPRLTAEHKLARVALAREWLENGYNWENVVWSDEKKFNLDGPDGYAYYWHDLRKEERIFSKRGFGGGSLMIWGCFGVGGGRLATVSGRMNSQKYTEMLETELLPFGEELGGPNWVYQQDNAPIHFSARTREWFTDNGVRVLPWPSRSPDLNPIENVWGMLARAVYQGARQFETVEQLQAANNCAWFHMDILYMQNLISGMRRRLVKIVEKKGCQIGD